jgi:hypothetical protein
MNRFDHPERIHPIQAAHGLACSEAGPHETPAASEATANPADSGLLLWLGFGITPTSLPGTPDEEAC